MRTEMERRRRKRTDLDARLRIKRADGTCVKEVEIDVMDVSLTGLGFMCDEDLELNVIYEGILTIWTGEKLKVFLDLVRKREMDGSVNYGATFVGLPDLYIRKIGVYQTVEDEIKKQKEDETKEYKL